MRCAADAAKKAAAFIRAAASSSSQAHSTDDMSSVGQSPQPAALVAAGACGDAPHAYDGSPMELIYSGESDCASDSAKTARSPVSQEAADYEPSSKKARSNIGLMIHIIVCLIRRMGKKAHPLQSLLRIRLCANATMVYAIVEADIVIPLPLWVSRKRL